MGFFWPQQRSRLGGGGTGEPGVNMMEQQEFLFLSFHLLTTAGSSFYWFPSVSPYPCEDLYFRTLSPSSPLFCMLYTSEYRRERSDFVCMGEKAFYCLQYHTWKSEVLGDDVHINRPVRGRKKKRFGKMW